MLTADHRTITVRVDRHAIEDGEIPPPVVGEIATFAVTFEESETAGRRHGVERCRAWDRWI